MVDAAPNGDIVVACPDGAARVFSSDVDRQLPAPEIRTYKEMVTAALVKMGEEAQGGAAGGDGGMVGDLDTENMKGQCALMLITRRITHTSYPIATYSKDSNIPNIQTLPKVLKHSSSPAKKTAKS